MYFWGIYENGFFIFAQGCNQSWGVPYTFEIFLLPFEIFNSNPKQHLRCPRGYQPHPEILLSPLFTLPCCPQNSNLSDHPPSEQPPQNFGELDSALPLEMYPHPKKTKTYTFEHWNMNIKFQNLKIRGELGFF